MLMDDYYHEESKKKIDTTTTYPHTHKRIGFFSLKIIVNILYYYSVNNKIHLLYDCIVIFSFILKKKIL